MKISFRWYGDNDPITLEYIKQIPGVTGIVSSCFDVGADTVISVDKLTKLKEKIAKYGFDLTAFESIPVHENVKLGTDDRDKYIDIWTESLRNVAKVGVKVVCYNFMLAFDWLRTEFRKPLPDGSYAMAYNDADVETFDFFADISSWAQKYTPETLEEMLKKARSISTDALWNNLEYFLKKVVPVAEEVGVKLAIHPDDPPFSVMGIPRIISTFEDLKRFIKIYDSPNNGLGVCTGALSGSMDNDVESIVEYFSKIKRVNFMHVRNVNNENKDEFYESAHLSECGSRDMYKIMKSLHDNGFDGPLRPDHGRDIWGEENTPGYGLYDRALGVMYIQGLLEAIRKSDK